MRLWDHGLWSHLVTSYNPQKNLCPVKDKTTKSKPRQLSLRDLDAAFIVIGIGLSLSFIAFILENLIFLLSKLFLLRKLFDSGLGKSKKRRPRLIVVESLS